MSVDGFKRGLMIGTPAMGVGVVVGTASLILAKYTGAQPYEAFYPSLFVALLAFGSAYAGLRIAYFDTLGVDSDE